MKILEGYGYLSNAQESKLRRYCNEYNVDFEQAYKVLKDKYKFYQERVYNKDINDALERTLELITNGYFNSKKESLGESFPEDAIKAEVKEKGKSIEDACKDYLYSDRCELSTFNEIEKQYLSLEERKDAIIPIILNAFIKDYKKILNKNESLKEELKPFEVYIKYYDKDEEIKKTVYANSLYDLNYLLNHDNYIEWWNLVEEN